MDKLEKALEKARETRAAALKKQPSSKKTDAASHHYVSPMMQIDEAHLDRFRVISHRARSKQADIFRILRTRILHIMNASGLRTFAITSPNYGDGKTTIALNLAVSIALDLKQTILLADLDLRKPGLTHFLGAEARFGLSDYLLSDKPISECLLRTSFDRLAILPAGRALDHSSEALASPKMAALADELKTRYDDRIILYDMPPVLAQDDPIAFLPHVDAVLVVVDEVTTKIDEIQDSMNALAHANVIGTVLNHSGSKKPKGLIKGWFGKKGATPFLS